MLSKDITKLPWLLKIKKYVFYLSLRELPLHDYTFWFEECGVTCQWMVTRMFRKLIGIMVEVYVDDMVVKSKKSGAHAGLS